MAALGKEARCSVVVDRRLADEIFGPASRNEGITAHAPEAVSLEEAIEMVVQVADLRTPQGVGAWIENELVVVGPRRWELEAPKVTLVYDVSPLVEGLKAEPLEKKMGALVRVLNSELLVDTNGLEFGSVQSFDRKLIVRATVYGQQEVAALLEKLRGAAN